MSEYKYTYNKDNKLYKKSHTCSDSEHSIKLDFQGERVTYYFKNIGTYHKFKDAYENKLFYIADDDKKLSNEDIKGGELEDVLKKVLNKNSDYVNKILGIIFKNLKQKSLGVRGRDQSELSVKGSEEDYIPKLNRDIQKTKEFKNFTGAIKSRTSGRFYFCKNGKIQTATLYRFKIEGLNKKINGEDKSPFIDYLRKMEWGYPNPTKPKYKDLYNKYELARIEKAGPPSRKKEEKGSEEIKGDPRSNYGTVSFLDRAQKFRVYFKSSKILGGDDNDYTYQTFVINSNDLTDILELTSGHKVESIKVPNKAAGRNTLKSFDISTIIHYSDAKSNYLDYEEIPFERKNLHSFKKKPTTPPATKSIKATPPKTIYKTIEELPGWKEAAKDTDLDKNGSNIKPSGKISVYIPAFNNKKLVNAELEKTEFEINGFKEKFWKIKSGTIIESDGGSSKIKGEIYIFFEEGISTEIIDADDSPSGVYAENIEANEYKYILFKNKETEKSITFKRKYEFAIMSDDLSNELFTSNNISYPIYYDTDNEKINIVLDHKSDRNEIKSLLKFNSIYDIKKHDKLMESKYDLVIEIKIKQIIKSILENKIDSMFTNCDIDIFFEKDKGDIKNVITNKKIQSIENRDCTKIKIKKI